MEQGREGSVRDEKRRGRAAQGSAGRDWTRNGRPERIGEGFDNTDINSREVG